MSRHENWDWNLNLLVVRAMPLYTAFLSFITSGWWLWIDFQAIFIIKTRDVSLLCHSVIQELYISKSIWGFLLLTSSFLRSQSQAHIVFHPQCHRSSLPFNKDAPLPGMPINPSLVPHTIHFSQECMEHVSWSLPECQPGGYENMYLLFNWCFPRISCINPSLPTFFFLMLIIAQPMSSHYIYIKKRFNRNRTYSELRPKTDPWFTFA